MDFQEDKEHREAKISPVFAARLKRLKPQEKVSAIVMLDTGEPTRDLKKRPTKTARQAVLKKTREYVKEILPDIDRVLRQHRGKRLKSEIDGLSAVPVITTAAGINALISSQHVKAIIEDQALFRVA
jgi:hypothetical protein